MLLSTLASSASKHAPKSSIAVGQSLQRCCFSTNQPQNPLISMPEQMMTNILRHRHYETLKKGAGPARAFQKNIVRKGQLSDLRGVNGLVEYLENCKGYRFSDARGQVPEDSFHDYQVLLSHMYTYPLTLASVWEEMGLDEIEDPSIGIIGPEYELKLGQNWRHLSDVTGQRASLHFIGPSNLRGKGKAVGDLLEVDYTVGLLEELPQDFIHSMDAFVAYMPSAGYNQFLQTWDHAFKAIKETGKPLLLTALKDDEDHVHDAEFWNWHFGERLVYRNNPFSALRMPEHTVIPPANGYLCVVPGAIEAQETERIVA